MSVILAVCGENFCAMASDGRMVEEPAVPGKPNILSEELPKLRKVNRNVCVGFAGDTAGRRAGGQRPGRVQPSST